MSSIEAGAALPTPNYTTQTAQQPKLVTLDTQGDVILRIGRTPTYMVRVSAARLSEVSKVFDRMFSGNFSEGAAERSADKPYMKDLPEDNERAVHCLLNLLYHNTGFFTVFCHNIHNLYWTAKTAKKYCCLGSFQLEMLAAIQGAPLQATAEDTLTQITVSYMLGDAWYFAKATRQLMVAFNTPLARLRRHECFEHLPENILLTMAEKRALAQQTLVYEASALAFCVECEMETNVRDYRGGLMEAFKLDDAVQQSIMWPRDSPALSP